MALAKFSLALPKTTVNLPFRKPEIDFSELIADSNDSLGEVNPEDVKKFKNKLANAAAAQNNKRIEAAKAAGQATYERLIVRSEENFPEQGDTYVGAWAVTSNVADVKTRKPRTPKAVAVAAGDSNQTQLGFEAA